MTGSLSRTSLSLTVSMAKGSKKKGRNRAVSWQRASLDDPPAGEPSEAATTLVTRPSVNESSSEAEKATEDESIHEASLVNSEGTVEMPVNHEAPPREAIPTPEVHPYRKGTAERVTWCQMDQTWQQRFEDCQQELETIQASLREAQAANKDLTEASMEAQDANKRLTIKIENSETEVADLREALQQQQDKTEALQTDLAEMREKQNKTMAVLNESEQTNGTLQSELSLLKDRLSEAELAHRAVSGELEHHKEVLTMAETRCQNFDALKEEFTSLQGFCETLQQKSEEDRRLAALMTQQHDAMKLQNDDLEHELEQLQLNQANHQDQLHQLTTEWEQKAEKWRTEKENMTALIQSREASESTQQSEYENLRAKLTKAIKKGKRIEEEKETLEQQWTAGQGVVEELKGELTQLKSEFNALRGTHGELQTQMTTMEAEYQQECRLREEQRLALTKAQSETEELKRQMEKRALEIEQMKMMNQEAGEKETTIRQKLQSAIKKGMRIENEKAQIEQQMAEVSVRVVEVMQKVPEMAVLKQQVAELMAELTATKGQLQSSFQLIETSHVELRRLQSEKEGLLQQHYQMEAAQKEIQTELKASEGCKSDLTASLEEATTKLRQLEEMQEGKEIRLKELESVIATKDVKLVRAREAIESLRKEKTDLLHKHTTLSHEVSTLRSENEILQSQQEDPQQNELQEKLQELQMMNQKSAQRLEEADAKLEALQNEKVNLEEQLKAMEEIQDSHDPPSHTPDPQVVEAVFQAASSVAKQLNLPFMESPMLSSEQANAQLQAVQIFLEGAEVGIKRNQDQLPLAMSEIEVSKETIRRLEDEITKLKKEATTPASSFSAVEIPTPSANSYPQGTRVKRRDLQEMTDTHVIDFGEGTLEDEPETKALDYTPLISVHAFRSAPPPVLHFMQTVDHQTQIAGRILGHRPIVRAGVLSYTVVLHILLLILIV